MKIINNNFTKFNGSEFIFTDANGTEFVGDIKDFTEFDTDYKLSSDVQDFAKENFKKVTVAIKDSDGNDLDISDSDLIELVQDDSVIALDLIIEGTHDGENLNHAIYTSESMQKDASSFIYPFEKPFIKNHCLDSEPIGRIKNAYAGKSDIEPTKDCINLNVRVTDKDAMLKFADGRYNTVSIAGSPKTIQCNICGKHILKDGQVKFCGHWKGNTYANKKSSWITTDIVYKECSVVNAPADVYAQVKEIKVIKKGANKMSKVNTDGQKGLNDIDDLLGKTANNQTEGQVKDNQEPNGTTVQDGNNADENNTKELTLEDAKAKISELEQEVTKLKDENTKANEEIKGLKDSNTSLNEKLSEATKATEDNLKMAKDMAALNMDILKRAVKLADKSLDDEKLSSKTAKELGAMLKDFEEKPAPTNVPKVKNPGIQVDDNHTVIDNNTEKQEAKKPMTLRDFEEKNADIFCI